MAGFKLHLGAFIIALAIGMLYVYLKTPMPKIVIKYPNPDNINKVVYKDGSDNCYVYNADKVTCPADKVKQPVSV